MITRIVIYTSKSSCSISTLIEFTVNLEYGVQYMVSILQHVVCILQTSYLKNYMNINVIDAGHSKSYPTAQNYSLELMFAKFATANLQKISFNRC